MVIDWELLWFFNFMETNAIRINIFNEVEGRAAVSAEDGEAIFEKLNQALKNNKTVVLDFLNVEIITAAFLNTAVGSLYKEEYTPEFLNNSIKVENIKNLRKKV